ncbi:protein sidekick [Lasius niger]|uniref:Protein sidekick n=1 Tax=Lasius niger TaxID=67767 RepID=A0A0J7KZW7_LASNI|nr:protein sidekick [Lasius niger]
MPNFENNSMEINKRYACAVPEGKPTITAAHNTSATSIYLAWKPPSRDTIHGEFLGYRIGYRRREKADEEMKNIYIRDPAVDNHSIHNLDTFTQYLVSLQVFNPEGHGPASTVTVMTDEGEFHEAVFSNLVEKKEIEKEKGGRKESMR